MTLAERPSPIHSTPDVNGNPCPKRLGDLTCEEMHELIDRLAPKKEMLAGIALLHRVLDDTYDEKSKAKDFLAFFEKAQKILGDSGKLLRYDFVPQQGELPDGPYVLGHADKLRGLPMTRRSFGRTIAHGALAAAETALAAGFTAYGSAEIDRALHRKEPSSSPQEPQGRFSERVIECMDKNWWGPLDVLIGVAFGVDAGINVSKITKNREEEIFEQVSNAIAEFGQSIEGSAKSSRSRRSPRL